MHEYRRLLPARVYKYVCVCARLCPCTGAFYLLVIAGALYFLYLIQAPSTCSSTSAAYTLHLIPYTLHYKASVGEALEEGVFAVYKGSRTFADLLHTLGSNEHLFEACEWSEIALDGPALADVSSN